MPIPSAFSQRPARDAETFQQAFQDAAARPVTEIVPAAAGDGVAALGFALGWIGAGRRDEGLTLVAAPEGACTDTGDAYTPGLAQFGLDLGRLLHVRTRKLKEALWACEQALGLSQARVLCLVHQEARLTLTATRRLHLAAEKSGARCVLLRFDPLSPSAAWTRWSIASAPSLGVGRELGRPAFAVTLARTRSGQSGQNWLLEWNAHDHAFIHQAGSAVAGPVAAPSVHRPAPAQRRSAG